MKFLRVDQVKAFNDIGINNRDWLTANEFEDVLRRGIQKSLRMRCFNNLDLRHKGSFNY